MQQLCLGIGDERTIYPLFGSDAARLANDGAQIAFGEAHAVGIIGDLVLLAAVLIDELNETVEDGLLARARDGQAVGLLVEQMVAMVHEGCDKRRDGGAMVVRLMDKAPNAVMNVAECLAVFVRDWQLEIAHLPVEGRGELSRGERHGEIGKQPDALHFKVIREPDGVDDCAGAQIH